MTQVALFKPSDWLDKLICFFSRGEYSHSAITCYDGTTFEAKPFEIVKESSIINGQSRQQVIHLFLLETTPQQDLDIKEFLKRQVGKKYDYLSIFGIIVDTTREGRKASKRWFCSELVFAALEKAGILLLERTYPWKVTPVMISLSNKLIFNKEIVVYKRSS